MTAAEIMPRPITVATVPDVLVPTPDPSPVTMTDAVTVGTAGPRLPDLDDLVAMSGGTAEPAVHPAPAYRVLAVAAHPADAVLGAGVTLLTHEAAGDEVGIVTLAPGAPGAGRAGVLPDVPLGAEGFLACTIPDTGPSVALLEEVLAAFRPDVVYTHSINDRDPDHRSTHRAVMAAAHGVGSVYCFEIPSTTAGFAPARYVDADDHLAGKLALLSEEPAGSACARVQAGMLTRAARHWGRFAPAVHAEPLEIAREAHGAAPRAAAARTRPAAGLMAG